MSYLLQLVIILLLTKLGAHLSNIFNFPSVIGELLVGVLAGPAVLNLLAPNTFTHYFAELGVIVLMFIAGLEGDLKALLHYWKPSLTVAILGVIVPTASAFLLCYYVFGFSAKTAIFLGLILSATSVSITVQVLREMQRLNSPEGSMILGAAVADDIICVILLGICVSLFGTTATSPRSISLMLGLMLLFFVLALSLGKWFVPKFLAVFSRLNASENETTAALVLCFGFAFLAVSLGMSDVLGAYFAGLFFGSGSAVDGSRAGGWPACFGSVGVGHWHGADWFVANAGGFAGGFGYCGSVGFATGGYVFPFCSGG